MKKTVVLSLIVVAMVCSFGTAFATGYPFLALAEGSSDGTSTVIILGKFHQGAGQFTLAEADGLVTDVVSAITAFLGSTGGGAVLTPQQLTNMGYGDADVAKGLVKSAYLSAGIEYYIFLNIKKASEYHAGHGPNLRIDLYVADMASLVGLPGDYLYAGSIEFPYMFTGFVSPL